MRIADQYEDGYKDYVFVGYGDARVYNAVYFNIINNEVFIHINVGSIFGRCQVIIKCDSISKEELRALESFRFSYHNSIAITATNIINKKISEHKMSIKRAYDKNEHV